MRNSVRMKIPTMTKTKRKQNRSGASIDKAAEKSKICDNINNRRGSTMMKFYFYYYFGMDCPLSVDADG